MGYRPSLDALFGKLPVITGGTRTFEVAELSDTELARLNEFLEYYARQLSRSSPEIGEDFRRQADFFRDLACVAKARFDNKPFNEDEVAELPRAGQMGVAALISQDRWDVNWSAVGTFNNWDIAAVAGTPVHILGSPANWYTTRSVVEERCMIGVMKNGIVESGTTPTLNQLRFFTQAAAYPPWRASILRDIQLECDKPAYQYHTPAAMIFTPDMGVRITAVPTRTGTISPRLVGLVFGEYGYLNNMTRGIAAAYPFIWN